jgi:hypothetical protein
LYALGRPIVEILPYVPIAFRLRTGVSVLTYHGRMSFGVTSDYDTGPDAGEIVGALGDELAELVEAAQAADAAVTAPCASAVPRRGGARRGGRRRSMVPADQLTPGASRNSQRSARRPAALITSRKLRRARPPVR